jgi:hypothetical protein
MAHARVVEFDGVDQARMDELVREIQEGDPPADVPATEIIMLHDAEGNSATVILFFESEADYERGHATLDAMPAEDTPGRRSSVKKYKVAGRMTA